MHHGIEERVVFPVCCSCLCSLPVLNPDGNWEADFLGWIGSCTEDACFSGGVGVVGTA